MDAVRAILEVPVIQQRSAEWYERRKARITASEVAAILGQNPYEGARDVMLRKRGLGKPFTGNIATRYGQAHEAAAIAAYCAALGRVSFEVGLIDYEAIHGQGELSFLAGSPDGITVLRPKPRAELGASAGGARVVRLIGPNGDEPPPLVADAAVLALDEATANVDAGTDAAIGGALAAARKGGRTLIVIAHRLDTVLGCDQVLVLDDGRLVEAGPPRELRTRAGPFARLAAAAAAAGGGT